MTTQKIAEVRVCASCKWIFRMSEFGVTCPECRFGSCGARSTFGNVCYRYELTQEPWMNKKMEAYRQILQGKVDRFSRGLREAPFPIEILNQTCS